MKKTIIGALAVMSALALGAACEQNSSRNAERGSTTSAPASRGPGGDSSARGSGSSGMASGSSASSSSSDLSGTGGSGDAGMGRDAGR